LKPRWFSDGQKGRFGLVAWFSLTHMSHMLTEILPKILFEFRENFDRIFGRIWVGCGLWTSKSEIPSKFSLNGRVLTEILPKILPNSPNLDKPDKNENSTSEFFGRILSEFQRILSRTRPFKENFGRIR
jgi:hypothetical protein